MRARVLSINITSIVHQGEWTGSEGRTGIDKRSVAGAIEFKNNGVVGDRVIDTNVHGGYEQAVYAYAREDAQWWEREINEEIPAGRFGENLTTEGIDVNAALVGEQWKIGSVILEVSQPRIPCRVFAGFWKRATLIKDFTQAGRPGTYLRIIQECTAQAGDSIEVIFKPDHTISISDLFAAKSGERSKINQIKDLTYLSNEFKEWSQKIAATQN
jgi:MOSC domain-containing protein YiiM